MLILTGSAAAACASNTLFWRILTGCNPHPQHSQSPRHGCQPAADALLPLRTAAISTLHQPPHALLAKSASDIKSQKPDPPARAGPLHALLQQHVPPALPPAHSSSQAAAHCPHPRLQQASPHSCRAERPCQQQAHSPRCVRLPSAPNTSRPTHLLAKSASDTKTSEASLTCSCWSTACSPAAACASSTAPSTLRLTGRNPLPTPPAPPGPNIWLPI
jgi:hypothetical protein